VREEDAAATATYHCDRVLLLLPLLLPVPLRLLRPTATLFHHHHHYYYYYYY